MSTPIAYLPIISMAKNNPDRVRLASLGKGLPPNTDLFCRVVAKKIFRLCMNEMRRSIAFGQHFSEEDPFSKTFTLKSRSWKYPTPDQVAREAMYTCDFFWLSPKEKKVLSDLGIETHDPRLKPLIQERLRTIESQVMSELQTCFSAAQNAGNLPRNFRGYPIFLIGEDEITVGLHVWEDENYEAPITPVTPKENSRPKTPWLSKICPCVD